MSNHDHWSLEDDEAATVSLADVRTQDAYWEQAHARENYFRAGLDYEDYAPAYCVGYIGYVQYGGDYAEAEKSLISNWVRIKGDSRLELEEARQAMRAAWNRAAECALQPATPPVRRPEPFAQWLGRLLQGANAWLDRIEQRVGGTRAPAARPLARRQDGLARH